MALYYWNRYFASAKNTFALQYISADNLMGFRWEDDYLIISPPSENIKWTNDGDIYSSYGRSRKVTQYDVNQFAVSGRTVYYLTNYIHSQSSREYFNTNIYELKLTQTNYEKGSFISTFQADANAYTNNARNADGYWYERGAKVNTAPTSTQIPTQSTKKDLTVTINLANYFSDPQGDALTYSVSSGNPSVATATISGSTLTLIGKEIGSVWITVDANDGEFTTSQGFALNVTNTAPTVSVTSPTANMTLYENDVFNIAGSAADVNANQSVTIYGQVNLESKFVMGIGLSNAAIPFSKQLKFKGGRLFDGDIGVTRNLTDGIPHTLKIWAQDSDGGQSTIVEHAFYVVPNRPPILTVDAVQPSGIINTDKFSISGTASDPDKNPVTAAYRLNGGNSVELEIVEGKWAFDITLAQLQVGQNTIVVELMDSYDFKVSKTIKLNKNEVNTPILQSVARYKIEPPKGSAKGVLLFLERDEDMELEVSLSMTLAGEQEQYVILTPENTAPMPNQNNVVEDTFYHEANEPKNNIILKLSTSRETVDIHHKIHLISGVVE
ncbi:hypothetical protein [Lysinibacillus sp. NPDC047702]|uniref:hypothetical protein n=1 Tax=unclassified Lysinibacillus TaxID=2636778 RepID=UPI003CFBF42A